MRISVIALLCLLTLPVWAQRPQEAEKPAYAYLGEPVKLSVACANDEIEAFGIGCSAELPCPVFLELSSVEFMRGSVYLAGNLHTDSVTMYSVLLASEDGGLNWTEPHERILRTAFDKVEFYDDEYGWALGYVVDPAPKDPFFLLTTDGGKIWRRRPVFDDGRSAIIEEFWFDSGRSGGILVELTAAGEDESRYQRYETMTGAESWMIREISTKPIRRRRRVRPAPDEWRITASLSSRAWEVQKRDPAGWVTIAEFQVDAGLCAPPPEVFAEAPPPEPDPERGPPAEAAVVAEEEPAASGVFVIKTSPAPMETTQEAPRRQTDEDQPPTLKKPKP